ncbi:MAG: glycosyltransferase [Elusimicrobia bacterium]|nr:glycosyltransferase [Elusimicrobiota bacterium]
MSFRILHVNTERGWRGGERQTLWLARELERRGHGNVVAARPKGPLARAAAEAGLRVFPLAPWSEWDFRSAGRLRAFLRQENIQVVHAHTGHAVGFGALARRGTTARLVATRRVDFPLKNNFLSRWKYRSVDALAAISTAVRRVVIEGGVPESKISVIPSGVDPAAHPSVADRNRFRSERGFTPADRLVVHVGALVPHKDQATLLRAFALLRARGAADRLLILGDGPRREELERLTAALRLEDAVSFLGHRGDVLEYTAMADLFVFPSVDEGLGTALLDALVLGVPTAATAAGGIPDLYGGPGAPELTPPGDVESLARNMAAVLENPEEARRRAERGRERARGFSVSAMTDRYEALYQKLLEAPCPA